MNRADAVVFWCANVIDGLRPLLPAEILSRREAGTLPDEWRTVVEGPCMRPLLSPGSEVTLIRRAPQRGDVVCLVSNGSLVWRRVVGGRAGHLVVRADIAPAAEVWTGDILGCVTSRALAHRLVRKLPRLWTGSVWRGAFALAQLRVARARAQRRRGYRPAGELIVRVLEGAEDRALVNDFGRRVMGLSHDVMSAASGMVLLGAFDPAGALVGHYTLMTRASPAWSAGLFVAPAFRGRGVGARLVRALIAHARTLGVAEVRCSIRARNLASVRAHEAAGFVRLRETPSLSNYPENQTWSVRLTPTD